MRIPSFKFRKMTSILTTTCNPGSQIESDNDKSTVKDMKKLFLHECCTDD